MAKHKVEQLDTFYSFALPEDLVMPSDAHPKVAETAGKPWLFGYTPNFVTCDIEPEGFGSVRIYTLGAVALMCIPGKFAKKVAEMSKALWAWCSNLEIISTIQASF